MPELIEIAFKSFILLSVIFAVAYGLYRLIRFGISRMPDSVNNETWEGARMILSVPSTIIGFLTLVALTVWMIAGLTLVATDRWWHVSGAIEEVLILVAGAGIFSATVFGIYQDYPPTRLKLLGAIAAFSILAGIGLG